MTAQIVELLAGRRTIRRYTNESIPDQTVAEILQAGLEAPSYLDRRPQHFVVIRDKDVQEQLGSILSVRPYVQDAAVVIALLGDPRASSTWDLDLSASAENMLMAASGLGLGAAWAGNPRGAAWDDRVAQIRELLNVPDEIGMLGLITIGHPAETKPPHSRDEVWDANRIHFGLYNNLDPGWKDATSS
jgi:nitroreductase